MTLLSPCPDSSLRHSSNWQAMLEREDEIAKNGGEAGGVSRREVRERS